MIPFATFRLHYGTDDFELRQVFHRNHAHGGQEVRGLFQIVRDGNGFNFEQCINDAVAKLTDLITGTPTHWCFKISHHTLRSNTDSLFINYSPIGTNVGALTERYLYYYQQSGCQISFKDRMYISIIAHP